MLVLLGQYLLFWATTWLFKKLKIRIQRLKDTKLKPISIQDYELLDTQKQVNLLIFLANILRPFSRVVAANRETPLFRLTLAHRLVENDLAQADRLGRHLDILVLLDIFERFL